MILKISSAKLAAILSRPQCVNTISLVQYILIDYKWNMYTDQGLFNPEEYG